MSLTKLAGNGRSHGYVTCTVVSGASESTVADLHGFCNYGLLAPTIDSSAVTFSVSNTVDGTYRTVTDKDASTALTVTSGTGNVAVESTDLKELAGYRYVKIGTSATQTADRTFIWTVKG